MLSRGPAGPEPDGHGWLEGDVNGVVRPLGVHCCCSAFVHPLRLLH